MDRWIDVELLIPVRFLLFHQHEHVTLLRIDGMVAYMGCGLCLINIKVIFFGLDHHDVAFLHHGCHSDWSHLQKKLSESQFLRFPKS